MAENYEKLVQNIIEFVGGKDNITSIIHCVSRLRFDLKDEGLANEEAMKALDGVSGCQKRAGQFQVIIGLHVKEVYNEVCRQLGKDETQADKPEKKKTKLSIKSVFNGMLNALVASVVPVLPVIVCYGLTQLVILIFGAIGIMPEESGAYQLISLVAESALYFLPVFVAYSAAKHFNTSIVLALLMGTAMVSPTFLSLLNGSAPLNFFGIPIAAVDYTNSIVPIIFVVWIMSYVEKLFKRIIPKSLNLLLVPFLTVFVMIPIAFCAFAPLGYYLSMAVSSALYWLHNTFGPVGIGVLAAVYNLLILTGMHHTVGILGLAEYAAQGFETFVYVATSATVFSTLGIIVAFLVRSKKKENKKLGKSTLFMNGLLGLSEPTVYGILVPFKRIFLAQIIGAFVGGIYMGITGVKSYMVVSAGILCIANFIGGDTMNMVHGLIGLAISFAAAFAAVLLLGFKEDSSDSRMENPLNKYLEE